MIQAYANKPAEEPDFFVPRHTPPEYASKMEETIDWGIEILGIPDLWRQTRGEGIRIAILDTGIASQHTDLRDAIEDMKDFSSSVSGPSDVAGHGTHVAGTIAARENSSGVIGGAPESKLLIGKVLGDNGSGSSHQVAQGILWAVDQKADIISMSLGASSPSKEIHEAVKAAYEAGIFIITAAGNEGPRLDTVGYPAKYPETVAVGAVDRRMQVTQFSSRGEMVDIVAPGDKILSTFPPNTFATLSGTSMATPLVSAVVALTLAKHKKHGGNSPIRDNDELKQHLSRVAVDLGPEGFDPHSGFGLIDPVKLVGVDHGILEIPYKMLTEEGRVMVDSNALANPGWYYNIRVT